MSGFLTLQAGSRGDLHEIPLAQSLVQPYDYPMTDPGREHLPRSPRNAVVAAICRASDRHARVDRHRVRAGVHRCASWRPQSGCRKSGRSGRTRTTVRHVQLRHCRPRVVNRRHRDEPPIISTRVIASPLIGAPSSAAAEPRAHVRFPCVHRMSSRAYRAISGVATRRVGVQVALDTTHAQMLACRA